MRLCVLARVMRLGRVVSASPKLPLRSSHRSCAACITSPTATLLLALRAITSPVGDTTCACAHYQFLRLLSLLVLLYLPLFHRPTTERTPREDRLIEKGKIARFLRFYSFVSSCTSSGKRPRRNQRRTKERPKKSRIINVLFIKIDILNSLTPFLKRLTPFLKKLTHFLKKLAYLFKEKSPQKAISLAQSKIFHYLCEQNQ